MGGWTKPWPRRSSRLKSLVQPASSPPKAHSNSRERMSETPLPGEGAFCFAGLVSGRWAGCAGFHRWRGEPCAVDGYVLLDFVDLNRKAATRPRQRPSIRRFHPADLTVVGVIDLDWI